MSDCGRHGLTIIAFLGSVFSPYYALARRRGPADPLNHAALNVALYGEAKRFALTERERGAVRQGEHDLAIGPSSLRFDGTSLVLDIREVAAPLPRRIRGRVRLHPSGFTPGPYPLDAEGRHLWWPIAPASRIEVAFSEPTLSWTGEAYFDTNAGSRPLERDFSTWWWCRAPMKEGAGILYEVTRRDGSEHALSLAVARSGEVAHAGLPPKASLPPTRIWRIPRPLRCDLGCEPLMVRTFEDTPFYARSEIETDLLGQRTRAVHESLSMDRFVQPIVQMMLPFRMPRRFA